MENQSTNLSTSSESIQSTTFNPNPEQTTSCNSDLSPSINSVASTSYNLGPTITYHPRSLTTYHLGPSTSFITGTSNSFNPDPSTSSNAGHINLTNSNPYPNSEPNTQILSNLPTYAQEGRSFQSPVSHPIGEPRQGRIGLTLRDIQALTTPKVISLYDCIYDMYERDDSQQIDLFTIVQQAWRNPVLQHACSSTIMTEVRVFIIQLFLLH